jgi:hypothetical protein
MPQNYLKMLLQKSLSAKSLCDARDLPSKLLLFVLLLSFSSAFSQCPTPPGDQSSYGNESWIGYVYFGTAAAYSTNPPTNPFATEFYKGYITQTPHFDQDYEYDAVYGAALCGGQNNTLAIRYKMTKYYAAGTYTFTVGGDDGYRLSIDGGSTYLISNWYDHGYTSASATATLAAGYYNLVFEYYENAVSSRVSYFDTSCTTYSTAPTTITGIASICKGSTTTFTASGGVAAAGSVYQWGYGTTAGYYIINGQTGASVTVGPNQNENIWVRRIDAGSCSNTTLPAKIYLTVMTPSTAPTSIGGNDTICPGESTILTASGGSAASGAVFQWGTGTAGNNIIAGETGSSITVSPASTTSYWVRRSDNTPCAYTGAVSKTVTVTAIPGNPAVFGSNRWNAYGYSNSDLTLATAVYTGFYTQSTLGFDTQSGINSWNPAASPANAEGWSGCTLNNDSFTFVYKRKGFPCGNYTIAMTSWDDACIVYIDGVPQWGCSNWSQVGSCDGSIGQFTLNGDSEIEVRVREDAGNAFASLSLINIPTAAAGTIASLGSTTLCANTRPGDLTLSGHSGSIVKWQSAEDAAFTTGVTDIACTSATLTSAAIGSIPATRYFRAVVQEGSCDPNYTASIEIMVPAAVTYANGAWSGTINDTTPIVVEDNLVLNANLTACSCEVRNGKTLTVSPDVSLTLISTVTVASGSHLIIEDSGSLIQVDDSAVNAGSVEVKRDTEPMKNYDYTYWSAPVQGNTLFQLSPLTLSDKYYRFDPTINNWVSIAGGAQVMEPGKGYIVRAPQGWAVNNATSGVYGGQFSGVPNNGIIPATITKGAGTYNLIGNPYPSAIDIDLFLTDPANAALVNGTVHLWTHNTAISAAIPGNAIYNYTVDDYAKYNLTGGIRSASPAVTGGAIPLGKIAAGQGFFIEAATGLADGTYTVNFNNSMRVTGDNGNFYRSNQSANQNTSVFEKYRYWIAISNTQGAYSEVLVGYISNATNGADALFDGKPMASASVLSMYSINGADNYAIQGRALPFTATDVVPLGYKTTIGGVFTIAIEEFDGLFQNQDIYLVDRVANVTQELKMGAYTFTSGIGTFNDRFEIRYADSTLSTADPADGSSWLTVYQDKSQVAVSASKEIATIMVYDLLGREIYASGSINATEFKTAAVSLHNQIVLVKALFADGNLVTKKLILK